MAQPTWAEVEEAAWLSDNPQNQLFQQGSSRDDTSNRADRDRERAGLPSIPAWQQNDQDVTDFGPIPFGLEKDIVVLDCPDCGKPVLEQFLSFHRQNCALVREIVAGRVSVSVLEGKRRKRALSIDSINSPANASLQGSSVVGDNDSGPSKKKTRKEEKLAEVAARKKARLAAKEAKANKKKNRMNRGDPLDVDRQCGVVTEKGICTRSLTCKSHSMGAKRAVEGRSRSYDDLLFEWQKATNPAFLAKLREKERVMAEAARERQEERARKMEAKKKRLMAMGSSGTKKKSKKDGHKKKSSKEGGGGGGGGGGSGMGSKGHDGYGGKRGDGYDDGSGSGGSGAPDIDADMFKLGASEGEVEAEFDAVLDAIRIASGAPRTMAMPLAVSRRNFGAGAYAHKAMRFRALRAGPPIF